MLYPCGGLCTAKSFRASSAESAGGYAMTDKACCGSKACAGLLLPVCLKHSGPLPLMQSTPETLPLHELGRKAVMAD